MGNVGHSAAIRVTTCRSSNKWSNYSSWNVIDAAAVIGADTLAPVKRQSLAWIVHCCAVWIINRFNVCSVDKYASCSARNKFHKKTSTGEWKCCHDWEKWGSCVSRAGRKINQTERTFLGAPRRTGRIFVRSINRAMIYIRNTSSHHRKSHDWSALWRGAGARPSACSQHDLNLISSRLTLSLSC